METLNFLIDQKGYFGVSLLDVGSYGAHLMNNSLARPNHSALFFAESETYYHSQERALSIEGLASSPDFAMSALASHARVAREMDELTRPFVS